MRTLGNIIFNLKARTRNAEKNLQNVKGNLQGVQNEVSETTSRIEGFNQSLKASMKTIRNWGLASMGAAAAITAGITKTIEGASDAEEILNKFVVVFGEYAEEANEFAINLSNSLGRATSDVRMWMASLQDTFVPLGVARDEATQLSKDLVELAVDVASFNNEADETVVEAFTSAIVGNHRAVRRYGIVLSQVTLEEQMRRMGIRRTWDELNESEKAQVRYNAILEATSDAHGDAERTAMTWRNRSKALRGELTNLVQTIGRAYLPVGTQILRKIVDIVVATREWIDDNTELVARIAVIGGAITAALAAFGAFATGIYLLSKVIAGFGVITGLILSPFILKIATIATLGGLLYKAWNEDWGGVQGKVASFIETVHEKLKEFWDWFKETNIGEAISDFWDDITGIWTDDDKDFKEKVEATIGALKNLVGDIIDLFVPEEVQEAIKKWWKEVREIWEDGEKAFWTKVAETVEATIGLILNVGEPTWKWLKGKITNIGDFVKAAWKYFIEGEEDAFEDVEFGIGEILVTIAAFKIGMAGLALAAKVAVAIGKLAGFVYVSGKVFNLVAAAGIKIGSFAIGISAFVIGTAGKVLAGLLVKAFIAISGFGAGSGVKAFTVLKSLGVKISSFAIGIGSFVIGTTKAVLGGLLAKAFGAISGFAYAGKGMVFSVLSGLGMKISTLALKIGSFVIVGGATVANFVKALIGTKLFMAGMGLFGLTMKLAWPITITISAIIFWEDIKEGAHTLLEKIDEHILHPMKDLLPDWLLMDVGEFEKKADDDPRVRAYREAYGIEENAEGGRISGPGTGTSDSILSWLSNGEYVINAAATKAFLPVLEAINNGKKFAKGGYVGKIPSFGEGGLVGGINFEEIFERISETFDTVREFLPEPLQEKIDKLVEFFSMLVQEVEGSLDSMKDLSDQIKSLGDSTEEVDTTFGTVKENLVDALIEVNALTQFIASGGQDVAAFFTALLMSSEAFGQIVDILNFLFETLVGLIDIALQPIMPLIEMLGELIYILMVALEPFFELIAKILLPVFELLAEGVRQVVNLFLRIYNWIARSFLGRLLGMKEIDLLGKDREGKRPWDDRDDDDDRRGAGNVITHVSGALRDELRDLLRPVAALSQLPVYLEKAPEYMERMPNLLEEIVQINSDIKSILLNQHGLDEMVASSNSNGYGDTIGIYIDKISDDYDFGNMISDVERKLGKKIFTKKKGRGA